MIRRLKKGLLPILLLPVLLSMGWGQELSPTMDFRGELTAWALAGSGQTDHITLGLRYIPVLSAAKPLSDDRLMDSELSFNTYGNLRFEENSPSNGDMDLDLYRAWVRWSSSRMEIRAGLQKISFGPAVLLRPLMWFDSIDPRDPVKISMGVYGILGRYYFLNNTNIWLWGLFGNDDQRGWDRVPSDKTRPEFGGRVQFPLWGGEAGLSFHHRWADWTRSAVPGQESGEPLAPEDRLGLDYRLDLDIGLWFEAVLIHHDRGNPEFQRLLNLGLDYTLDVGNGLFLLAEHFWSQNAQDALGSGESVSYSALSLNYPLGIFDDLTAIFYYDWENDDWYRHLNWQRSYDNWRFHLIGFWNPEGSGLYQDPSDTTLTGGKGLQLMVVFNH